MSLNSSLKSFKMPESEGSRNFFHLNPAEKWTFEKYMEETHKQLNKHRHYKNIKSDYIHDLEWIHASNQALELKNYIQKLLNNIPSKSDLKGKKGKKYQTVIKDNNITINIDTVNIQQQTGESSSKKRQFEDEEDEEGTPQMKREKSSDEASSLWRDWVEFLNNSNNASSFRPYSPEYHGVVRCGFGISHLPNLDLNLYSRLLAVHAKPVYNIPAFAKAYFGKAIDAETIGGLKKALRIEEAVDDEDERDFLESLLTASYQMYNSSQNLEGRESVFNDLLIFPFMKAIAGIIGNKAEFVVGETPLLSMKKQLDSTEESDLYLADGIVRLYGPKEIEILVLETSSHFGCKDKVKINFDHHKALFGTLAMLKTIAGLFYFGSSTTFVKVKVFFLQAAGKTLYLWSLRFVEEGSSVYELWLEDSLVLQPSFEQRQEVLPNLVKFYWGMKDLLEKSIEEIKGLEEEHLKVLKDCRLAATTTPKKLSDSVCPSIMKLSEGDDKKGLQKLGPFFCK